MKKESSGARPAESYRRPIPQAEEITETKYNELMLRTPDIDFSRIVIYEKDDETQGAKELACMGNTCEIDISTGVLAP